MPDMGVILRSARGLECCRLLYQGHGFGIMLSAWQTEPVPSRSECVDYLVIDFSVLQPRVLYA